MDQQIYLEQRGRDRDREEIDLLELMFYFKSKFVFILIAFIAGAAIAGGVTWKFIPPKYTATAKMYMVSASSNSVVDLTDLNLGTSLSSDYGEMIKIRPILNEVIEKLSLDYTYEELLEMLTVSTIGETRIMTISVESLSPEEAKNIANALADEAVETLPKLMDTPKPNIAEEAITPERKSSPSYTKNILLGALAGAVLVMAVLTVLYLMDDTLKSAEDVEKAFGVMPLTVIPEGHIEGFSEKAEKKAIRKQQKEERKNGRSK